jgi:hypothetical protein
MENIAQGYSNVNPVALLFLVSMSLVMLQGQRRTAVKALLAIAAFLPLGQQIVLFGLHFQFFRILIVVGFIRLLSRGEFRSFKSNRLDKLFIAWALVGMVCGALRDPGSIMGTNCLGGAFNAFGTYFLIRVLIKDPTETLEHLRFLALAAVVVSLAMCWEYVVHRNLFAVFGGVPNVVEQRDGHFRCQGPFEHPILAGTFAATLFPLLAGLWLAGGRDKRLAFLGMTACAFISTVAAASSGALLTCLTAVLGLALWPMRAHMRLIRRGTVLVIIGLALVMKAPVWYLIAKVSDVLGGTGWHRSYLIEQAVNHFGEWWLIGSSVTAHWAPGGQVLAVDPNNMDITNHYIAQGLHGGILGLWLFLAIIVSCFKLVGPAVRVAGDSPAGPKVMWAFGVGLACHCMAFISISYFDQMQVFWFWMLAVFAALATWVRRADRLPEPAESATAASSMAVAAGQTASAESVRPRVPSRPRLKPQDFLVVTRKFYDCTLESRTVNTTSPGSFL